MVTFYKVHSLQIPPLVVEAEIIKSAQEISEELKHISCLVIYSFASAITIWSLVILMLYNLKSPGKPKGLLSAIFIDMPQFFFITNSTRS